MKKLRLSRLLHVLVLVPLLALAVFGGLLVLDSFKDYQDIERVSALGQVVNAASRLTIKALNEESDASHAFVATGADRERTTLMAARQRSDLVVHALQNAAGSSSGLDARARELINDIEMQLRGLDGFRSKADARTLARRDSGVFLQPLTSRLADLVHRIARLINEAQTKELLFALHAIMQMNDGVRIENGRTEISLRDGPLDTQTYQTLLLGLAKQSVFSQQFADVGPRPAQELLREFSAGPHGRTIEALRPAILAVNHGGTVSEADARQWREAMTARIAVWARAVQTTLDELTATTEALSARAKWRLIAFLMGALTVIVAVVCLNRVVLGIVRRLLGELTQVMQKLAERRLAVEVPSRERSDEIGTMARTVEIFKQNAIAIKELEDERAQQKERTAAEKQAAMRHFADAFEGEVLGVVRTLSTAATQLQHNA